MSNDKNISTLEDFTGFFFFFSNKKCFEIKTKL